MEDLKIYFNQLEKEGYIGVDGKPLKCLYCDSKDLIDINIMKANYGIEEYEVQCNNCKNITGRWAYGYWTLL